jgi:hypothetical protein
MAAEVKRIYMYIVKMASTAASRNILLLFK